MEQLNRFDWKNRHDALKLVLQNFNDGQSFDMLRLICDTMFAHYIVGTEFMAVPKGAPPEYVLDCTRLMRMTNDAVWRTRADAWKKQLDVLG